VLLLGDVEEKFSTFAKFSNEEADAVSFPSLVKLDDVGMVLKY